MDRFGNFLDNKYDGEQFDVFEYHFRNMLTEYYNDSRYNIDGISLALFSENVVNRLLNFEKYSQYPDLENNDI